MATELPPNLRVSSLLSADHEDYRIDNWRAIAALSRAEDSHFWHLSRNELILARLRALKAGPSLIELGCGAGVVAGALSRAGFRVVGVDGHLPRLIQAAGRAPRADFIAHDLTKSPPPVETASFDCAALFDVIEHLDEPRPVLEDALALVRPNGLLVGTVPALRSLWSSIDEDSGHKRRYTRATLEQELRPIQEATLLEIVDFNRHLVPMMWLQRRLLSRSADESDRLSENLRLPFNALNESLLWASRVERVTEKILRHLPLRGASLWFALRKGAGQR